MKINIGGSMKKELIISIVLVSMVHADVFSAWTHPFNTLNLLWDSYIANQNKRLLNAIYLGNLKDVDLALGCGANPNMTDCTGMTLLMIAVSRRYPQIVKRLLEAKADANVRISYCRTAMEQAIHSFDHEITEILLRAGVGIPENLGNIDKQFASRIFLKIIDEKIAEMNEWNL